MIAATLDVPMFGTVSLAATKFKRLDNNRANRLLSSLLVYPEVAKRLNLEGTVRIEAVVGLMDK